MWLVLLELLTAVGVFAVFIVGVFAVDRIIALFKERREDGWL